MCLLNWFKRLKQSRGHGVHSPFAYKLITQVCCSPHSFYAFFDIPKRLRTQGVNPRVITPFNHLSFRLVHYFNARNILEVNPGTGINTLFLMAPSTQINCTWLKGNMSGDSDRSILPLLPRRPCRVVVLLAPREALFDAIFVNASNSALPSIDQLLELGHERTFWVIHSINKGPGKQYWKQIVNEKKINVTFEGKEAGIVFPWDTLTPSHYFI